MKLISSDPSMGYCLLSSSASRVLMVARQWQKSYSLCDAELDVLSRSALGEDRELIAEKRASSQATVKAHIANLLKKTRDPSLHRAVQRLLRAALNMQSIVPTD